MIKIRIYNENYHEQIYPEIAKVYPEGIHGCLKNFLKEEKDFSVSTCTFDDKNHGLSKEILQDTDILIFWSHAKQDEFSNEVAENIHQAVLGGMGFIGLHSAHFSKPMKKCLGTSMSLKWQHNQSEKLWCINPLHPIASKIPEMIELPREEMYGEFFDIPKPDDIIFAGWFSGGQIFRSGCTWTRGKGKIFYFQPGHEEYPIYYDKNIQQIIKNAVRWCYNENRDNKILDCIEVK